MYDARVRKKDTYGLTGQKQNQTKTKQQFIMAMTRKQLIHILLQLSYKDCIPNGFEFKYDFVNPNKIRERTCAIINAIALGRLF